MLDQETKQTPRLDTTRQETQQEIIDLLKDQRFNKVEIIAISPLDRAEIPAHWTHILNTISNEAYNVLYRYVKRIAPWDRQEVGTRRAWVARLERGPRGAMGQIVDSEEETPQIEIDPVAPSCDDLGDLDNPF